MPMSGPTAGKCRARCRDTLLGHHTAPYLAPPNSLQPTPRSSFCSVFLSDTNGAPYAIGIRLVRLGGLDFVGAMHTIESGIWHGTVDFDFRTHQNRF